MAHLSIFFYKQNYILIYKWMQKIKHAAMQQRLISNTFRLGHLFLEALLMAQERYYLQPIPQAYPEHMGSFEAVAK